MRAGRAQDKLRTARRTRAPSARVEGSEGSDINLKPSFLPTVVHYAAPPAGHRREGRTG